MSSEFQIICSSEFSWKLTWTDDYQLSSPKESWQKDVLSDYRLDTSINKSLLEATVCIRAGQFFDGDSEISRPVRQRLRRLVEDGYLKLDMSDSNSSHILTLKGVGCGCLMDEWKGQWVAVKGFYMRMQDGSLIVEAPGAASKMEVRDSKAAEFVAKTMIHPDQVDCSGPLEHACCLALVSCGLLLDKSASTSAPAPPLEWHEQVFHAQWRLRDGFSDTGASCPGIARGIAPPTRYPQEETLPGVELPDPKVHSNQLNDWSDVLKERRSVRAADDSPMDAEMLSSFLHACFHPLEHHEQFHSGQILQTLWSPTAAGGSLNELDLFIWVWKLNGLEPGFYYYAKSRHVLVPIALSQKAGNELLFDCKKASHYKGDPGCALLVTSRIERLAWKYRSMAYAITLQNTGCLLQTFYLVATALGIAPCAIGNGRDALLSPYPSFANKERLWLSTMLLSRKPK
jgi:SagB-type dehydrogenase family enzyme